MTTTPNPKTDFKAWLAEAQKRAYERSMQVIKERMAQRAKERETKNTTQNS